MKRLHAFAIRRPWLVLSIATAVTLAIAPGILRLRMRTDGHALVPHNAPAVRLDDAVRREFGVSDPLVVLIRPRHPDGVFNARTLHLIDALTWTFTRLPGVDSNGIQSLATEPTDHFRPGTLQHRRLLEPVPETREQLEALRGDIDAIALLTGTLISDDGGATAILAGVAPGADRTRLVFAVRDAIANADTAGHDVSILGAPVAEALLGAHILDDLGIGTGRQHSRVEPFAPPESELGTIARLRLAVARHIGLLPIAFTVMALVFLLCFRSIAATLLPLTEALACLLFVFGLMGWIGVPVYLTMAVLPVILVSMGLADEIHVFTAHRRRRAQHPGEPVAESVRAAFDETCLPVIATGLTTMAGFLAFALSPLAPVRAFGIFTAAGIVFCMVWTLTVIPALLVLLPLRALGGRRERTPEAIERVPAWIEAIARLGRWPALTLSIAAVMLALSPLAIRRVAVQDSWISGFARESAFYRATQYFNQHFHGAHRLLLAVDTGHLDVRGPLPAADMGFEELMLPGDVVPDPAWLVGCSLAVTVHPGAPNPRPDPSAFGIDAPFPVVRPMFWTAVVERAERRGDRIAIAGHPTDGSARFLLMPAPAETLDFVLRSQRLAVPAVLRSLDSLERFVRAQSHLSVGGVLGPPDHITTAEFLMSDRAEGYRSLPRDVDRVRWLWNGIESERGAARRREIVDPLLERGLITIFLENANYIDTARLMAAVRDYERTRLAPQRIQLAFAGDVAVSQALIEAIVRSQVGSLLASLAGILLVSAVLFRSWRWGLFCMAPAGLAVAATFAVMGLAGMPLGVATSMFASMVLGIGVDFAIHLVERYRTTIRRGVPHELAIREALVATAPAIVVNALAITLGFGILGLSQVPANAQLGAITVVSLLGCLVATLLVIPALLRIGAPRGARAAAALAMLVLAGALVPSRGSAATPAPEASATRLMATVEQGQRSQDRVFSMDVTLASGNFQTQRRILGVCSTRSGVTQILYVMTEPPFYRGATLLVHDARDAKRPDRMWVVLPGLGTGREVEATSLRLMVPGTGLTFEDSRGWIATDKYRFTTLAQDESIVTLEALPRTDSLAAILGTTRVAIRVDATRRVVLSADFFDAAGTKVRSYEADEFVRVGAYWYPAKVRTSQVTQRMKATIAYRYRRLNSGPPGRLLAWRSSGAAYLDDLRAWRDRAGFATEFPDTLAAQ